MSNIWSQIGNWFRDFSEREKLIREFNHSAKYHFVNEGFPVLLQASISLGNKAFKHKLSKLRSGFKIDYLSGHLLGRADCEQIAFVILNNTPLCRSILALGWDTLEIVPSASTVPLKYDIKVYCNIGLQLTQSTTPVNTKIQDNPVLQDYMPFFNKFFKLNTFLIFSIIWVKK